MQTLDTDASCKQIYKGDIAKVTSLDLRVFKSKAFIGIADWLRDLLEIGEIWTRSVEYQFDGKLKVMLNRYYLADANNPRFAYVQIQDVTNLYQEYIDRLHYEIY